MRRYCQKSNRRFGNKRDSRVSSSKDTPGSLCPSAARSGLNTESIGGHPAPNASVAATDAASWRGLAVLPGKQSCWKACD